MFANKDSGDSTQVNKMFFHDLINNSGRNETFERIDILLQQNGLLKRIIVYSHRYSVGWG